MLATASFKAGVPQQERIARAQRSDIGATLIARRSEVHPRYIGVSLAVPRGAVLITRTA